MIRCSPTSAEDTVRRILERRQDPLWAWPVQARTEFRAIEKRVDQVLLTLAPITQRIVACRFTERWCEATIARQLDIEPLQVRAHLSEVYRTLAHALGLTALPKRRKEVTL
jgi:hypothetical protein